MPRAVALKLQPQSAVAVVVRTSGGRIVIESVASVPLVDGESARAVGQKIAAALGSSASGRTPTVVAVSRVDLHWANYDLPPAPMDELPNLVLLQAQRDIVLADDGVGFDYVSLQGDAEHPHRILGVGLSPVQLDRIRAICSAAELKLQRIVPEPFGWVELSRRVAADIDGGAGGDSRALTVFAAMAGRQAAVWAMQDDALRLVRTVWLSSEPTHADDVAALAGELRRTLLSLAQTAAAPSSSIPCVYVGERSDRVASELAVALGRPIRSAPLEQLVEEPGNGKLDALSFIEAAPLAALAAAAATERTSPVDLLHPHRPPAPPNRRRTYALAGAAAACVALALAWGAYRRIAEPREAAAAADAQHAELAPTLTRMAEVETQAAAVDAWLNSSVNLLTELDYLGQQLRPKPLSDASFNSGEDLILTKLALAGRQITIDAAARTTEALTPIERRLRAGNYRVIRGVVESTSELTPGYAARMSEVLERLGEGESAVAATAPGADAAGTNAATAQAASPASAAAPASTSTTSTATPAATTDNAAGNAAGNETKPAEESKPEGEAAADAAAPATTTPATSTFTPSYAPAAAPAAAPSDAPAAAPVADPFG